jgi:Phosphopantetheine attachment site.
MSEVDQLDGEQTEQAVLRLWREVLGVADAQPDDDFFELGGDSITATRLVFRFRSELGIAVPLLTLFEHPTPNDLMTELGLTSTR